MCLSRTAVDRPARSLETRRCHERGFRNVIECSSVCLWFLRLIRRVAGEAPSQPASWLGKLLIVSRVLKSLQFNWIYFGKWAAVELLEDKTIFGKIWLPFIKHESWTRVPYFFIFQYVISERHNFNYASSLFRSESDRQADRFGVLLVFRTASTWNFRTFHVSCFHSFSNSLEL